MRPIRGLVLLSSALFGGACLLAGPSDSSIRGRITDGQKPVPGVRVRFQGEGGAVLSDRDGCFQLPSSVHKGRRVTAWKEGYAIAAAPADRLPLQLMLVPLPAQDNDDYAWVDPTPDAKRPNQCGNCHGEIYREWAGSAHANAAKNRRLHNLLEGTDWHGRPSAAWNMRAEHPLGTAVCATCHAPTYRDPGLEYDLTKAQGVTAHGVHCDYCHKIVDAPTDSLGTRFGKDGLRLLRPESKRQLFFGPLDDAYREGESFGYNPLYKESRYCASCHEGVVFGVHVYGTYSEWLESPARRQGQQCQDCHMTPTGKLTNIALNKGGLERDPKTLASHNFPGGQADMLRRCLKVSLRVRRVKQGVRAEVEVTAENVGHRVPTGFIDRNLLLVVEATDRAGKAVALRAGTTLPLAAGKGFVGLPGWLYAKRLHAEGGRSPVPFWMPHREITDSRLSPGQLDRRSFTFTTEAEQVCVRLLYRRFWRDIGQSKGWPDDEILVTEERAKLTAK